MAERDGGGGSGLAELGALGRRRGNGGGQRGWTAVLQVQMEKSSATQAKTDGLLYFFPGEGTQKGWY